MQLARQRLLALQEELGGVEETEAEMAEVMKHVDALQRILDTGKKLKLSFSSVKWSDLLNIGVERRVLRLNKNELSARVAASSIDQKHIEDLVFQITRIRRSASKRFEAGARMILDAILLTIADISVDKKLPVAIFPEMRIGAGDGVLVTNSQTQFQLWLCGAVDYGICTFEEEEDRARILTSTLDDLMVFSKNRITLVEAKRENQLLGDSMPEAASQAIALSEISGNRTIRYCLSDGDQWMFAIYTRDDQDNSRVSYEGPILNIMDPLHPVEGVKCLVELLYHWLKAEGDPKCDPLLRI